VFFHPFFAKRLIAQAAGFQNVFVLQMDATWISTGE
jgi:hypothetical protein